MKSFLFAPLKRSALVAAALALGVTFVACDNTPANEADDATEQGDATEQVVVNLDHLADPPSDPQAAIREALVSGELSRALGDDRAILHALLECCGVPEASQVLVFSKTSEQSRIITPRRPRAIYFSDNCYIGWVPGGMIEISDTDPISGTGFYVIQMRDPGDELQLTTHPNCLNCHAGSRVNHLPGLMVRSIYPDFEGFPIAAAGSFVTGHDSPIAERWGGWYVTGQHGQMRHMGNTIAVDQGNYATIDKDEHANLTSLSGLVDTDIYLKETSDIVALMVLEHQVEMHNLLTQGAMQVRRQYRRSAAIVQDEDTRFDPYSSDTLMSLVRHQAQDIVQHMLFSTEFPLASPLVGNAEFQEAFRMNRRESSDGMSLKDFDLETRIFRHRCSYMIYARAFELMHPLLKEQVYQELWDALSSDTPGPAYAHLGAQEKADIIAILRETREGLPAYWYD